MKGKFSIPNHVSSQAKDLLNKILVTDPNKRYNTTNIKNHSWFNLNNIAINSGISITNSVIPVYFLIYYIDRCQNIK